MVSTTSSDTATTTAFVPEHSSPLQLLSADIPGISLVPNPFSGTGFGGWRRNMVVSLSARNKIAFVDGSFPRPSDDSPSLRQWNRCNHLVISWITSSLSPEIAESVQYSETAESIWNQLDKRYGTVNGTKIFELKEIASTSQGCLDIASYFNKLKKLWDELGFISSRSANRCTCTARTTLLRKMRRKNFTNFLWASMRYM